MKLSELISQLTEIYEEHDEMNVAIIRNGSISKEIELEVDNDYLNNFKPFLWIKAYKPGEAF
mgnify:CR=1 FL=1